MKGATRRPKLQMPNQAETTAKGSVRRVEGDGFDSVPHNIALKLNSGYI